MRKPQVDYRQFRFSKLNTPQFSHLKLLLGWVNEQLEQRLNDIAALQADLSALINDAATDEELAKTNVLKIGTLYDII